MICFDDVFIFHYSIRCYDNYAFRRLILQIRIYWNIKFSLISPQNYLNTTHELHCNRNNTLDFIFICLNEYKWITNNWIDMINSNKEHKWLKVKLETWLKR